METGVSPNQTADSLAAIVFDTSSGISLEEQKEILTGINAMTIGNRLASSASFEKAKRNGFIFPFFVNLGAAVILAAGFLLLPVIHVHEIQEIRRASARAGLAESMLIQEILEGANPAMEELMKLGDERERASRTENLVSGFFAQIHTHIEENKLDDAFKILTEARDFLDTPLFRSVRSLEAGRRNYLSAINALERAVFESRRIKEAAAIGGGEVFDQAMAELNQRYAALEKEYAVFLEERDSAIAEKEALMLEIGEAKTREQEVLNRREAELAAIRSERDLREQQVTALNATLANEIAQKEELQRQVAELRARLP